LNDCSPIIRKANVRIHPTAIVEDGVVIGEDTAVWDNAHLRGPSTIGHHCIIGEKTYIAYGVRVGDFVKINAMVYIPTGVTIEDRVMIAAGVIFTNDRTPRAFVDGEDGLAPSSPNEDTLETLVRAGASIGAGAVIGPGIEIGRFAMVGMGAVVTRSIANHALVYGNPARAAGYVCVCGNLLWRADDLAGTGSDVTCARCGRSATATRKRTGDVEIRFSQAALG
jgi:Acetyltransferase (isoleucine patch superfamily)